MAAFIPSGHPGASANQAPAWWKGLPRGLALVLLATVSLVEPTVHAAPVHLPMPVPDEDFIPIADSYTAGRFEEALAGIERAKQRVAKESGRWLWLQCIRGVIYYRQNQKERAEATFALVLKANHRYDFILRDKASREAVDAFKDLRKQYRKPVDKRPSSRSQEEQPRSSPSPPPPLSLPARPIAPQLPPQPPPSPRPEPPREPDPRERFEPVVDLRLGGELKMGRLLGGTPEQWGVSPQLEGVLGTPGAPRLRVSAVLNVMLVHSQPDPSGLVVSPAVRLGLEVPWGGFSALPYGVAGPSWNFVPGRVHQGSRLGVGIALLWADAFRLTFEWTNEKYGIRDTPRGALLVGVGLDTSLFH